MAHNLTPPEHLSSEHSVGHDAIEKMDTSGDHREDSSTAGHGGLGKMYSDASYVDHRAEDDRADAAKGRNADKFDRKYWLSWRFLGTMWSIGIAFMGGIGGK